MPAIPSTSTVATERMTRSFNRSDFSSTSSAAPAPASGRRHNAAGNHLSPANLFAAQGAAAVAAAHKLAGKELPAMPVGTHRCPGNPEAVSALLATEAWQRRSTLAERSIDI